jgi:hypothetical protein
MQPSSLTVACATPYCKRLADGIADVFKKAGWKAVSHHGGGLGVDGVSGVAIYTCPDRAALFKEAVSTVLKARLDVRPEQKCTESDYLVVGEKPF